MSTERELAEVLAPCPFCGGVAKVVSYRSCDCCGKVYNGMVMCSVCAANVDHRDNDADAIAAWNRRPALLSRADGGEATLVARKHRGSLADSMATAQSIPATEASLRDFFEAPGGKLGVAPYGWDQRIGWDTHIVTIDGAAIGFTNAAMAKERGE